MSTESAENDWLYGFYSLGIMAAVFLPVRRAIRRMSYSAFFYGMAILFGRMHLANFGPDVSARASTFSGLLYLLWYMADKSAAGVSVRLCKAEARILYGRDAAYPE